jgi:hypothetical protein
VSTGTSFHPKTSSPCLEPTSHVKVRSLLLVTGLQMALGQQGLEGNGRKGTLVLFQPAGECRPRNQCLAVVLNWPVGQQP